MPVHSSFNRFRYTMNSLRRPSAGTLRLIITPTFSTTNDDCPKAHYHQSRPVTAIYRRQCTTSIKYPLLPHHSTHTNTRCLFVNALLSLPSQGEDVRPCRQHLIPIHLHRFQEPTNHAQIYETSKYRLRYCHHQPYLRLKANRLRCSTSCQRSTLEFC